MTEEALLPDWPSRTIAVLSTLDGGPHAIPVSAPVRAAARRILLSLHRDRDSLARLRREPRVALTVLTEGDVAFTARGRARIAEEPMSSAPDYVAVAIEVEHVDDHRQAAFEVESGIGRRWVDENEKRALGGRVKALGALAAQRTRTATTRDAPASNGNAGERDTYARMANRPL